MVIISALVTEYCGKVSISPTEMLRGTATRLTSYARESNIDQCEYQFDDYQASVRDACLLTMLRLSVECDDVPEEVTAVVVQLSKNSSAHLRRVGSTHNLFLDTDFDSRDATNS